MLSIIIPTLNCRDELVRTLDAFALRPSAWEIVISDGGSTDGTLEAAELAGARTLVGPAGRGRQLAAGADAAGGVWFLFWHADTQPQPGWVPIVISDEYYEHVGGFMPLPLMEDVDIVRRIGHRRLVVLDTAAVTSAVRYRRDGWWGRPIKNITCLSMYLLGMPISMIRKLYG